MRLHMLAVLGLSVAGAFAAAAQQPAPTPQSSLSTRIIGVFDSHSGEPLAGVQVRDVFSGFSATTTVTGTATLVFLVFRGEAALVELRKIGYEPKRVIVSRADSAITEVLEPLTQLAPMVTTETYRIDRDPGMWDGFDVRCQSRSVTCIRDDDLAKHPAANLASFLIRADGMTIGACGGGSGQGSAKRSALCGKVVMRPAVIPPAFCEPTFFVDGIVWDSRLGPPIDLVPGAPPTGIYTPANVKAVEVYPPERTRPLRFQGGDPACGVVVIWSK